MYSPNSPELYDVCHAHLCSNFPFAKSWTMKNLKDFLYIFFKTDSLAYVDQILSDYHNSFSNCVPWPMRLSIEFCANQPMGANANGYKPLFKSL